MKALIIFLILSAICLTAQSQDRPDSTRAKQRVLSSEQKHMQIRYYQGTLKVDSIKAEQVNKVQSDFKAAIESLATDKTLGEEVRRARIQSLIAERNQKLAVILSPEQLEKIIPSTERQATQGIKKD